MKGFLTGLAVSLPVTALLAYLVLTKHHEVETRLERHEVRQQIDKAQFDADFRDTWNNLAPKREGGQSTKAEIDELKRRDRALSDELDTTNGETEDTRRSLGDALKDAAKK